MVAISSHKYNGISIAHQLQKKGWILNSIPNPPSFHITITMANVNSGQQFVSDLRDVIKMVKSQNLCS
jgi:hypothetical protein